jgi:hypothetical protein
MIEINRYLRWWAAEKGGSSGQEWGRWAALGCACDPRLGCCALQTTTTTSLTFNISSTTVATAIQIYPLISSLGKVMVNLYQVYIYPLPLSIQEQLQYT